MPDELKGPSSIFSSIELILAEARGETTIGRKLREAEAIGAKEMVTLELMNGTQAGDLMQFFMSELQALRSSMAVIALELDRLRGTAPEPPVD